MKRGATAPSAVRNPRAAWLRRRSRYDGDLAHGDRTEEKRRFLVSRQALPRRQTHARRAGDRTSTLQTVSSCARLTMGERGREAIPDRSSVGGGFGLCMAGHGGAMCQSERPWNIAHDRDRSRETRPHRLDAIPPDARACAEGGRAHLRRRANPADDLESARCAACGMRESDFLRYRASRPGASGGGSENGSRWTHRREPHGEPSPLHDGRGFGHQGIRDGICLDRGGLGAGECPPRAVHSFSRLVQLGRRRSLCEAQKPCGHERRSDRRRLAADFRRACLPESHRAVRAERIGRSFAARRRSRAPRKCSPSC